MKKIPHMAELRYRCLRQTSVLSWVCFGAATFGKYYQTFGADVLAAHTLKEQSGRRSIVTTVPRWWGRSAVAAAAVKGRDGDQDVDL